MNKEIKLFIIELKGLRGKIPSQTLKTIKGQALAGDLIGARKGLMKILGAEAYDRT